MAIVWKELGNGNEKIAHGTFEATGSQVECGFKPKYIAAFTSRFNDVNICNIYDETISTLYLFYSYKNDTDVKVNAVQNMLRSSGNTVGRIYEVNDTGFKVDSLNVSSDKTMYYFAVG